MNVTRVTFGRRHRADERDELFCPVHIVETVPGTIDRRSESTVVGGIVNRTERIVGGFDGVPDRFRHRTGAPYRFTPIFFDEAGIGICDKCVAAGLRAGSIDVVNADEFEASRPGPVPPGFEDLVLPREIPGVIEARDILADDRWGCEASDMLDRALEAKRRNGTLAEFFDHLLDTARDHSGS
jgi:hypothetical protein